jgi:hypothetical protein
MNMNTRAMIFSQVVAVLPAGLLELDKTEVSMKISSCGDGSPATTYGTEYKDYTTFCGFGTGLRKN